jgi:MSHA biogenesis protein MshO
MYAVCSKKYQTGFTLIELIAVITVLAIVATIGSQLVARAVQSYSDSQERVKLTQRSRQAVERMARQIRAALPYSIRVTNGGACLQFLPVAGGGNYLDPVPDVANGATATATIDTAPYNVDFGSAEYMTIGALATGEVYGANPVSRATVSATGAGTVTLTAAKQWQRNSVNQRFFLVDDPQAFCLSGGELRLYEDQDITAANVDLGDDFDLMSQGAVANGVLFALSAATADRNAKVLINIGFGFGNDQINFSQDVGVRNVP